MMSISHTASDIWHAALCMSHQRHAVTGAASEVTRWPAWPPCRQAHCPWATPAPCALRRAGPAAGAPPARQSWQRWPTPQHWARATRCAAPGGPPCCAKRTSSTTEPSRCVNVYHLCKHSSILALPPFSGSSCAAVISIWGTIVHLVVVRLRSIRPAVVMGPSPIPVLSTHGEGIQRPLAWKVPA